MWRGYIGLMGAAAGKKKYVVPKPISWKSTCTCGVQRSHVARRARVSGCVAHAQSRFRSNR
jgi:hypothetical protein